MPTNANSLLQVCDLSCERDGRALFSGLNFALGAGCALQLEGANGAGKTTLIRTLIGSASEYRGEILWAGKALPGALSQLHQSLLYIGHHAGIRRGLTPLENLAWYGAGSAEALQALAQLDLYGFEDTPCEALSAGQVRRVALARMFLSQLPVLWVLDEPLAALDVRGVAAVEGQMTRHLASGGCLLLTSHQPLALQPLARIDLADYVTEAAAWASESAYAN